MENNASGHRLRRRTLLARAAALVAAPPACSRNGPAPLVEDARGLDFPGSAGVRHTMRFRFLDPLPMYPATYIWRAYPRRQSGYYTAFFWGNDDGRGTLDTFLWTLDRDADSYYGAHPYPVPPPKGSDHRWEIAIDRADILGKQVVYDRWYTQAMRVWSDGRGKHHEFYWDLPNTDSSHCVTFTACPAWGNRLPPVPALTWGDAPWAPGREVWNGVLRGIQVYTTRLSRSEMLDEAVRPRATAAGGTHLWYLNRNPSPDDIADKSGRANHPAWVGDERPDLWIG